MSRVKLYMKEISRGIMGIQLAIQVSSPLTEIISDKHLPFITERKKWLMAIVIRTGQNSNQQ